jgi:estrogen-related receptor beta like 1
MSRCYFVYPASNPGTQFKYFNGLVVWLLKKVGREANWGKYDDPNTTCTNMLIALRDLGIRVDMPPGKLKQGYGEGVCSVLHNLLTDVLKATEFQ